MRDDFIIALPTYNEEDSITEMVTRIREVGHPLFIVDSRSTDKTLEKAEDLKVEVYQRDEYGQGYGCGVQKAMDVALSKGYKYLGLIDCDTTYPPEDFSKLEHYIPEYDLVTGARPMKHISFKRRLGNYLHSWFGSLLFGRRIKDINSGMRIFRVEKFHGYVKATHMGMVPQMSAFAYRNRLKVIEVSIGYGIRKGDSKVVIRDAFDILWRIFTERFKKRVHPRK